MIENYFKPLAARWYQLVSEILRTMETKMVTGEQVKEAVAKAGITRIDHHNCGGCGYMTAYLVEGGDLYFDPGCHCGRWAPPEPRSWDSAADYINRQSRNGNYGDVAARVAAGFGITLEPA